MNETKNIFKSKTINGGIILLLVALLKVFGVEVGEGELATASEAVASVVGFALLVWGRFTANKNVTLKKEGKK